MTTTFTFGPDEQEEARRAMHATDAFSVIWSFRETLWEESRRAEKGQADAALAWLSRLDDYLHDAGIILEDLYS